MLEGQPTFMIDFVYLVVLAGFFLLSGLYAASCETL